MMALISTIIPILKPLLKNIVKIIGTKIGDLLKNEDVRNTLTGALGGTIANTLAPVFTNFLYPTEEGNGSCEGNKPELISPETLEELNKNIDSLKIKLAEVSEALKGISEEMTILSPLMIDTFSTSAQAVSTLRSSLMMIPAVLGATLIIGALFAIMVGVIAIAIGVLSLGIRALALAIGALALGIGALALAFSVVFAIIGATLIIAASFAKMVGVIARGIGELAISVGSLGLRIGSLGLGIGALGLGIGSLTLGMGALTLGMGALSLGMGALSLGIGALALVFAGLPLAIAGTVLAINRASKATEKFGNTVESTFKEKMKSLVKEATNAFNEVANLFKKEIKMNIKLPTISVSGAFSANPLQVPKYNLSWYKTGGIFTGPSVIGVGENGDEAVLPLSNKRRMKPFANAVASMIGVDKPNQQAHQGVTINIDNMAVRNDMDIKKIADEINRLVARENRKLGII